MLLGATEEDLKDFFGNLTDNGVFSGHSFLAMNEKHLIGICLNSIVKKEDRMKSSCCFDPYKDYKDGLFSVIYECTYII